MIRKLQGRVRMKNIKQKPENPENSKKPLGRSITIGCLVFILLLCVVIGIASYFSYKRALYQRYEAYITDILTYTESEIDHEDLKNCTKTLERSKSYDKLELFMDGIKEDFDIHYLYILTLVDESHIMSVISAENYYDRYIDTEGNLYLGWISDDEYDEGDVAPLSQALNTDGITFFEQDTEWSYDYTGAMALRTEDGEPYAILAVDVDISNIRKLIREKMVETSVLIIILGGIFTAIFLIWARNNITAPILLLEEGVVAFAGKSHGQRDLSLLQYDEPEIHTENEVELLSHAVTKMTEDMQGYVKDILSAEAKADQMEGLAIKDALTGIRNKTGYDREVAKLEKTLSEDPELAFGIVMIDLNYLKKINDTYGHEKGNISIKKLSVITCTVFTHSPVFRIGGDEFTVILMGWDLERIDSLIRQFHGILENYAADENLKPWEKISASIGYTVYDPKKDICVEDVFKRADKEMYKCKEEMHAVRE